jgi:hypothetical protein
MSTKRAKTGAAAKTGAVAKTATAAAPTAPTAPTAGDDLAGKTVATVHAAMICAGEGSFVGPATYQTWAFHDNSRDVSHVLAVLGVSRKRTALPADWADADRPEPDAGADMADHEEWCDGKYVESHEEPEYKEKHAHGGSKYHVLAHGHNLYYVPTSVTAATGNRMAPFDGTADAVVHACVENPRLWKAAAMSDRVTAYERGTTWAWTAGDATMTQDGPPCDFVDGFVFRRGGIVHAVWWHPTSATSHDGLGFQDQLTRWTAVAPGDGETTVVLCPDAVGAGETLGKSGPSLACVFERHAVAAASRATAA